MPNIAPAVRPLTFFLSLFLHHFCGSTVALRHPMNTYDSPSCLSPIISRQTIIGLLGPIGIRLTNAPTTNSTARLKGRAQIQLMPVISGQ